MHISPDDPLLPIKSSDAPPSRSAVMRLFFNIRRRVIAGLLLTLPFLITIWIGYWLFTILDSYVIRPAASLVVRLAQGQATVTLPPWFADWVAPVLGLGVLIVLLYLLGFFAKTRADRYLDYILLRLPIITWIHKAVRRVFASMEGQADFTRFKRAVLVSFPHPGMRVPGFVTSQCRDEATGRVILCVYVPTTPIPTSGYMLLIPEEDVTELEWSLEEAIQAVVSFGLTAPDHVRYFPVKSEPTMQAVEWRAANGE
jgi:uncharacterized membrane protein